MKLIILSIWGIINTLLLGMYLLAVYHIQSVPQEHKHSFSGIQIYVKISAIILGIILIIEIIGIATIDWNKEIMQKPSSPMQTIYY